MGFGSLCCLIPVGCGTGVLATGEPTAIAGPAFSGTVHGGQQAIAGAHVYLIGVSSEQGGGYRAYSMLGTTGPKSPQTLTRVVYSNAAGSGSDGTGNYVLTDANGSFTFSGSAVDPANNNAAVSATYECNTDVLVYVLALGGNPGLASGTNNSAIGLMGVLGPCATATTSPYASTKVLVNEITTVAATYALSGYLSGPNSLTYDGTALGATGLTNAANNAAQLASLTTGAALTTTPNGAGKPPAASVITLANILAGCINASGPTAAGCSTLLATATSDGTSAGTRPTETIRAMLNVAQHPGANVATLYPLASSVAPFPGGLSTAPNDFTLPIAFSNSSLTSPGIPAVDASGNVWFVNATANGPVSGAAGALLSPLGATLDAFFGGALFTAAIKPSTQVAIDPSGNAWSASSTGGVVQKLTYSGGTFSTSQYSYNGSTNNDGHQIAIDNAGNVYVTDYTNHTLYSLSNSGTVTSSAGAFLSSSGAAMLTSSLLLQYGASNGQNLIVAEATPVTSGTYTGICGTVYCGPVGIAAPTAIAVDGNALIWSLNNNSTLAGYNSSNTSNGNTGNVLTGSPFSGGGLNTTTLSPNQPYPWLAIDGGGNVWAANYTGSVSEFNNSGAAVTPAYTSSAKPGGYFGSAASCKGQGLAIDGSGDVWVSCDSATAPVLEYIGAAVPVATPILPGNFGVKP